MIVSPPFFVWGGERRMTGRWRELLSTLADAIAVVTALTMVAASVGYTVDADARIGLAVVGVAALPLFAMLAWLRRWAWWQAVRPKYLSAVVWLARPVRGDVAERLLADVVDPLLRDLAQQFRGLHTDALKVMLFALPAYESCAPGPCRVSARQVFPAPPGPFGVDIYAMSMFPARSDLLNDACRNLVLARLVSRYELKEADDAADVWLRGGIGEADRTGEVSRLVRKELKTRDA